MMGDWDNPAGAVDEWHDEVEANCPLSDVYAGGYGEDYFEALFEALEIGFSETHPDKMTKAIHEIMKLKGLLNV